MPLPSSTDWDALQVKLASALVDGAEVQIQKEACWMALALLSDGILKTETKDLAEGNLDDNKFESRRLICLAQLKGYASHVAETLSAPALAPVLASNHEKELEVRERYRQEDRILNEYANLQTRVTSRTWPAETEENEVVVFVETIYKSASTALLTAKTKEGLRVLDPLSLLEQACMSASRRIMEWYREDVTVAELSWEELVRRAHSALSLVSRQGEEEIFGMFEAAAKAFDWGAPHKDSFNSPIESGKAYAAHLDKILGKSPAIRKGETGWMYTKAALDALPTWMTRQVPVESRKSAKSTLRAIKEIPRAAYETEVREKAERHDAMFRLVNEISLASRAKPAQVQQVQPLRGPIAARGPFQPEFPASVPYASDATAAERPRLPASTVYFQNHRTDRSITRDQARYDRFDDTAAGKGNYAKALAAFERAYPDPSSTPITAKFPLSPGSLPLGVRCCDRCGKTGEHIAAGCKNAPTPLSEQNYRRAWRFVSGRSSLPPNWGRDGISVNLVADVDEWMSTQPMLYEGDDEHNFDESSSGASGKVQE